MRSTTLLSLAIASTIAFAPAAFAQSDTASGKHFAVVGGASLIDNKSDPAPSLKIDGGPAPFVAFDYYINDNIAIEAWVAADKFDNRVKFSGYGNSGTLQQRPASLSLKYQLGHADNIFRPFIGIGYHYTDIKSRDLALVSRNGNDIRVKSEHGVAGVLGVDMTITPTWFARADVRYLRSRPDVEEIGGNANQGDLKLDPWLFNFGVGVRF
ncbi:MAG: outer membrane beta-barrel protein [Xanthomonadaceae bacterium]|jgi:outer membrane protein|nr:outer membrane beta-barrel protein [Xanthomonadaceae bacterium]